MLPSVSWGSRQAQLETYSFFGASSTAIIIDVNAAKTLALPPPKTLLSDNEGISLSASVDVRMAEGRRLTVVDASNDTK